MEKIVFLILALLCLQANAHSVTDDLSDIPYPFYVVQDKSENQLSIIENGLQALQLRLDIIGRAKKTLELEYYIYKTDRAGKLITLALIDAAKRGVKVRLLVDKTAFISELDKYHALEFQKYGIELRFYNAVTAVRLLATQFRNHRKLLIADDSEGITGGRNIGEDYFNMSEHMNYNDRDVHVKGPIVKAMRDSFDLYFESKITSLPKKIKKTGNKKHLAAISFMTEDAEMAFLKTRLEYLTRPLMNLERLHTCPVTSFGTDAPGLRSDGILSSSDTKSYRYLRRVIFNRIRNTDMHLYIASPYMINNRATLDLMEDLIKREVQVTIHTNSLSSTDALYMVANAYSKFKKWAQKGVTTYLHKGKPLREDIILDETAVSAKWGVHDKSQVYDSRNSSEIMIGSYNIDNRSYHFNTEIALFCKGSDELSNELRGAILWQSGQGLLYSSDGKAMDKDGEIMSIYGSAKNRSLLMKFLTLPSKLIKYFL